MSDINDRVIAEYKDAFRAANGYAAAVFYDRGWFRVTLRGWIKSNHRRSDMLRMTNELRARAAQRRDDTEGGQGDE